jgi:asparagine synthase (glutamine-hydrolysing)
MCGISGFNWEDIKLIKRMNKEIAYRGPDNRGIYVNDKLSLGHVRLSIIDLSIKGNQPMGIKLEDCKQMKVINEDKRLNDCDLIIIFNGEVYNYLELREELKEFSFETDSDTEVILKSYIKWNFKCVKKFNGMWSFCIYDKKKNILFCSRDRLGQKPFFFYFKNNKFIFSSELKAVLSYHNLFLYNSKKINQKALELYFALGFIPAPYTIYKDIFKLRASHNLIFD